MERNQGWHSRGHRGSGGAHGAAAMMESSPRGLETRERRVDCRTRGLPYAYAYPLLH